MGSIISSIADVFGVGPASQQAKGVTQAAETGANASRYAADLQKQMFDKQIELQAPWREAGINALSRLRTGLSPGGEFDVPFSKTNWQTDPGYAFRLSEGNKALNASAAARGGLISGNALRAAEAYGQKMGSDEYQNAFNRYYAERNNMLSPIQSLAGVGQSATNTLSNAAGNYGVNAGNLAMTAGSNAANSALAMGNIRGSQYANYGNALGQGYDFYKSGGFKKLFGGDSGVDNITTDQWMSGDF